MNIKLFPQLFERRSQIGLLAFSPFVVLILVTGLALPSLSPAQAAIPQLINFQGKLTKISDGTNIANGTYAIQFKIYDALIDGNLLWTETYDQPSGNCAKPTVTNGVFNVKLGTCNDLADEVDFASVNLYATVNFAPTGTAYDGEMSPRKRLVATAFAFNANNVVGDGRIDITYAPGNSTNPGGKIVYNPGVSSANNALYVSAGSNVTGAALNVLQSGAGGSLLFGSTALGGATQTIVGFNPASFSGNFIDFQVASATKFKVDSTGAATAATGTVLGSQTFTTNNIADSGALTITSGTASNALTLKSGNNGSGTAGNLVIDVGTSTASNGSILIGTAARAQTITIGNTTGGTITIGASSGSDLVLQDAQWSVTGAGTAAFTGLSATGTTNIGSNSGAVTIDSTGTVTINDAVVSFINQATDLDIKDATASAFTVSEGANNYFLITTTNTAPVVTLDTLENGGIMNVGLSNFSRTINVGTGTAADTVHIGEGGVTANTITIGSDAVANTITIGSASSTGVSITDNNWSVTAGGALTVVSCSGCGGGIQTPWAQDVDAANFILSNIGNVGTDFVVTTGALNLAGVLTANGGITVANGQTLTANGTITLGDGGDAITINGNGTTDIQDTLTADNITTDTGGVSIAAGQSYTGAGAVTLSSGAAAGLTIDSASGRATVATGDFLNTSVAGVSGAAAGDLWYDSTANKYKINENGTTKILCNTTDAGCGAGGSADLQATYGTDADGSNATVALTTADDSIIFQNPNSSGTDSAFILKLDQLAAGAIDGLQIVNAGTGNGLLVNSTGSGNLVDLQKNGLSKFTVANTGGLTINGSDSSIVRTTTTEFATGTLTSLVNSNDQLELDDGTVPNSGKGTITTSSQPATQAGGVAAGAVTITRADGKYYVIRGGTGVDVYNSFAGTFSAGTVLGTATGAGVQAIPRADGRYLLVHGNAGATRTIVDPMQIVTAAADAGANFCASSGAGSGLFKRADGRFLVVCGNGLATTAIYDPVAGTWAAGPSFTAGTNTTGGLVLTRPDGRALIINGGATSTTQIYNPSSGTANIGVFTAGPSLDGIQGAGTCGINGAGSVSFRRQDGKYLILSKVNVWTVYDPVANTFTCNTSGGPATALGAGAHVIPMQNYRYLILVGGGSTASYVYNSSDDTFTSHGTATTAIGAGSHSILRGNGTWQTLVGAAATTTNNFDTGLIMSGSYQSDDISSTSINTSSIIRWTAQLESVYTGTNAATNTAFASMQFFVRTAVNSSGCTIPLNSATDREILNNGDLIRPASTDNCIRITATFNRPLPKRLVEERGTWTGDGSTAHRLDYATPTLFDVVIDNSVALRRTNFDFTQPNAGVAAPQTEASGPVTTRAEGSRVEAISGHLVLPYGRIATTTLNGTGGFYQGIMSAAHPNICAATTEGTVVIQRPDRQFLILSAAAANACLYDPASSTMTAQSGAGNIPTAAIGVGAFAIKRPDGKFLVAVGNSTTTNIYDPNAASGSRFTAGPTLSAALGVGAMAILNADGTYTIVHGGGLTTSTSYNPVRDTTGTLPPGPTLTTAANCGAWAIPMMQPYNNQYKVFVGVAAGVIGATTTMNYNATTKVFTAGTALATVAGCGSFTFQRPDNFWMIINAGGGTAGAGLATTLIMNPYSATNAAGPTLSGLAQRGATVIQRADGSFLILHGGNLTTTSIYLPWGGSAANASGGNIGTGGSGGNMVAGPAMITAVGQGSAVFQRPDGKIVIVVGSTTTSAVTNTYDAGWYADGQYLSEQMNVPALAANSTLDWSQTADNFIKIEVRYASSQAALGTASYRSIARPGQSIYNSGGETWVQIQINFRREFPNYCNARDAVYNTGGGGVYCNRTISLPTLNWYKINNGMDLINLQDNGLSVLRVTTSGNVLSSSTGAFYSGGADLAENYRSNQSLEPGEVVIGDAGNSQYVIRSTGQYQNTILGVVSTAPGFVAGSHTEDSYPIALVGRVPVKFSTENGPLRAGDYLTSSSIPGFAMRATQAGRALGTSLEDMDDSELTQCPPINYLAEQSRCGVVMVFVNLVSYSGASVEMLMQEDEARLSILQNFGIDAGDTSDSGSDFGLNPDLSQGLDSPNLAAYFTVEHRILNFLEKIRQSKLSAQNFSEIFTDRVAAAVQIITPQIYANGLTVMTISSLTDAVTFNSDLIIFGRPYFNSDSGGFAIITEGRNSVRVTFNTEYLEPPIVSVDMTWDEDERLSTETDPAKLSSIITEQDQLIKSVFDSGIRYFVVDKSKKGFLIVLNKSTEQDLKFSWIALAVKNAKIFGTEEDNIDTTVEASTAPTPAALPEEQPSDQIIEETVENPEDNILPETEEVIEEAENTEVIEEAIEESPEVVPETQPVIEETEE